MEKTLEQKAYELVGIKQFKKFCVGLGTELHKLFGKEVGDVATNYFIHNESGTIEDVKKFKNKLNINALIHSPAAVYCAAVAATSSNPEDIARNLALMGVNMYCLMLQRYNEIRLDNVVDRHDRLQNKKLNYQIATCPNAVKHTPLQIESAPVRAPSLEI